VISNKGTHFFVIHKLLLPGAAGHQQNIEFRRLIDTHFGCQNQALNIVAIPIDPEGALDRLFKLA